MATWDFTAWNDELPQIDHSEIGLARVLAEYVESPRLLDVLETYLDGEATISGITAPTGVQAIEDLAYQMLALRSVYTATGVNLDVLGKIVGQPRIAYAATDDVYRLLILVKILVNRSAGHLEELLTIIERTGITEPIAAFEYYPAALLTEATGVAADPAGAGIWSVIRAAKAGGVRWTFVYSTYDSDDVFTISPDPAADQNSTTQGTEVIATGTGGHIARSYT